MSNKHNAIGNKDPLSSADSTSEKPHDATHNVRERHAKDNGEKQGAQPVARPTIARPGIPFVTCPACNTGDLCPRRRSSLKDWLAFLVGLKPYRCNRCNERSYRR